MHTTTGVFVCFEGGEGTGKSTQARALADRLTERGYRALLTFEPGDTAVGKELRQIVLDPATGELSHATALYSSILRRAVETADILRPALDDLDVVQRDLAAAGLRSDETSTPEQGPELNVAQQQQQ